MEMDQTMATGENSQFALLRKIPSYSFGLIFCVSLLLMLVGCSSTVYKVGGETFRSEEQALAAQKIRLDEITTQITPTEKKRGGSAVIIIPTFNTFMALGVKKTGNPKQELVEYVGRSSVANYRAMFDFVDKRRIFDKVTLIEDDYPVPTAKKMTAKYNAVIYFDLAGPNQAQWFVRAEPNYKNMLLDSDKSKAAGYSRTVSWLDNIEQRLDESGYMPKR
jgi:hypothetical protein